MMNQPPSDPDEQDLIEAAKQGDLGSFNQLVMRYQRQVYNVVLRLLSIHATAEDITQEAFISAYRNLHTFRAGNFGAWLLRIASNASLDHLRSAQVKRNTSLELLLDGQTFTPQDSEETPEDYTMRRELGLEIQKGLSLLSTEQRLAIVLVDMQGYPYDEAADIIRIPVGTLKSRLSRARLAMRDYLVKQTELLPREFRSS
ncbi:sigma-70 family RNA polymerase sigma factor [SAR202 cluster bacterium AD-802-E10_MRT_200m]|nr:sigma-70 family RNA polymerase sigma factor [SAR202 cluster bacterium AD-802-E10_MRT_200m]